VKQPETLNFKPLIFMTTQQLIEQIKIKKSFLAIGLDVDLNKIQNIFRTRRSDFEFNKAIIDATHDLAVSYKPNISMKHMGLKAGCPYKKQSTTSTRRIPLFSPLPMQNVVI
jgi:predicted XRE-type DNA-binding protein